MLLLFLYTINSLIRGSGMFCIGTAAKRQPQADPAERLGSKGQAMEVKDGLGQWLRVRGKVRAPKDHINIRILPTMISGIPLLLAPGTRMRYPYVHVVFGPLKVPASPLKGTSNWGRTFWRKSLSTLSMALLSVILSAAHMSQGSACQ